MVEIIEERDEARGWGFRVRVRDGGDEREYTVRLNWVDHEHLSHGGASPASVAKAAVEYVLERGGASMLREPFDVARVWRLFPGSVEAIRERL